jgi:hypothetical protein
MLLIENVSVMHTIKYKFYFYISRSSLQNFGVVVLVEIHFVSRCFCVYVYVSVGVYVCVSLHVGRVCARVHVCISLLNFQKSI